MNVQERIYGTNLVCSFGNCNRAADFGCTTTVDNSVIHDEIPDHTEGIVQGTFGFVDDLVRGAYQQELVIGEGTDASYLPFYLTPE